MSLKERTHTTPIKEDCDCESQDRLAVTPCTLQMEADDSMISVTHAFKEKVVEVVIDPTWDSIPCGTEIPTG